MALNRRSPESAASDKQNQLQRKRKESSAAVGPFGMFLDSSTTTQVEGDAEEVADLDSRVAGHSLKSKNSNAYNGIGWQRSTGLVLKLVSEEDVRGRREKNFYTSLFAEDNDSSEDDLELRRLVPKFCGLFLQPQSDFSAARSFLQLEDISLGGQNVMDIKIGCVTWDADASEQKIQAELQKKAFPGQKWRILGFRSTNALTGEQLLVRDKNQLKGMVDSSPVLGLFMERDVQLQSAFVARLLEIRAFFLRQSRFQFVSSSLLFAWADRGEGSNKTRVSSVNMIDFAHVSHLDGKQERDQNYLDGLEHLIETIRQLDYSTASSEAAGDLFRTLSGEQPT